MSRVNKTIPNLQKVWDRFDKAYENMEAAFEMLNSMSDIPDELDKEIERCHRLAEQNMNDEATTVAEMMVVRVQTLTEVRNDLQGRLEELI